MALYMVKLDDGLTLTTPDPESARADYDAGCEVFRLA